MQEKVVKLAHGAGGRKMDELISFITDNLGSNEFGTEYIVPPSDMDDSAVIELECITVKYKTADNVDSFVISSDGDYIVAGSGDKNVYFFDKDGNLLWKYKTGSWVESVAISSDGSYIVAGSCNGNV
jgi:WD40 repeat protein